jgi:hypothetical protein
MSLDGGRRNLPCLGHVQGRKAAKIALNMAMGSFDSTVTQGDLKMVFAIQLEYVAAVLDLVLFNAHSEICS